MISLRVKVICHHHRQAGPDSPGLCPPLGWQQSHSSLDSILCSNLLAHPGNSGYFLESSSRRSELGSCSKSCWVRSSSAWTLKSYKRQCRKCGKGGASPAFFPSRASHLSPIHHAVHFSCFCPSCRSPSFEGVCSQAGYPQQGMANSYPRQYVLNSPARSRHA